jgi:hypothetical protein
LFEALPGAGRHLPPRLVIAFGEDRERFENAESFSRYAGITSATELSGNKCWVQWRYSNPEILRQPCIEWANQTVQFPFWAGVLYHQKRERRKTHKMTLLTGSQTV